MRIWATPPGTHTPTTHTRAKAKWTCIRHDTGVVTATGAALAIAEDACLGSGLSQRHCA
jgi:hypothetical protein